MNIDSLSARIKYLRGEAKQANFAKLIDININTLRGYESGQRTPTADTILVLCQKTNAAPKWLLSGEGPIFEASASESVDSEKTSDMSEVLKLKKNQTTENIDIKKNKTSDTSEVLESQQEINALNRELRDLLRENGDLRVDIERKKARIAELERELVRVLKSEEYEDLASAG